MTVADIDHVSTNRILVNGGSSGNVLPLGVLRTLGWDSTTKKMSFPLLVGLFYEKVYLEGSIVLPLILGERKGAITMVEEIVVVDSLSKYKAILTRLAILTSLAIHNFKVVPSTYH